MEKKVREFIEKFIQKNNEEKTFSTKWRKPLVAFISSDDSGFLELYERSDKIHLMPKDLLKESKSVIVYFLPFEENLSKRNYGGDYASKDWAQAYVDTNEIIKKMNKQLSDYLLQYNYNSTTLPPTHNFDKEKLVSWWSHKHIAYLAGMGNFGLHQMLITDSGSAGRFGSIVSSMPVIEKKQESSAGCLWIKDGSCGFCVKNCTFGALRKDFFDRKLCYEILMKNADYYEEIGMSDACGKCLANVPCSFINPLRV